MSNGADRFFDEMLESATRIAKKDVADQVRTLKTNLAAQKKLRVLAEKATKDVVKREKAITRKEQRLDARDKREAGALTSRERDLVNGEKEIIALLNQIDKITKDEVIETTKTITARKFVKRSTSGYGYYKYPTINSAALSNIKRRIKKADKESK
jgi:hypothetical protein